MMYLIYVDTHSRRYFSLAEASLVAVHKKSTMHNVKVRRVSVEKKSAAKPHAAAAGGEQITIERRDNRNRRLPADRRSHNTPVDAERRTMERRVKVSRRRQIDPTTCERDYTSDEIEFMSAIEQYKRLNGRMFPTCSEVLEVLKSLGYEKRSKVEPTALPTAGLPIVDLPIAAIPSPAIVV
jgi:hypothetical protein